MKGLSGARVVLVDDEPGEAVPVIKGVLKNGCSGGFF